jgi:YegS/Rv2252/BmrU family lipid kinase
VTPAISHRIIVNPAAARGKAASAIPEIRGRLDAAGLDYELFATAGPEDAVSLARDAARSGVGVVVAVGGDGILNEVLNGLMQAREEGHAGTALGLIAVGRGNDFAYGLGLPTSLDAACAVLAAGHRRRIDVGLAKGSGAGGGRYFGNGLGMGFDAAVNAAAMRITWLSGFASYAVAAFTTILFYFKAPLLRLEFAGFSLETRCLLVTAMLGKRLGGGFQMAPDALNDDGLFDLCIGQERTRRGIFRVLPLFLRGRQFSSPGIIGGRTAEFKVTALEGRLIVHADGETLCTDGTRLEVSLLPGAIELVG